MSLMIFYLNRQKESILMKQPILDIQQLIPRNNFVPAVTIHSSELAIILMSVFFDSENINQRHFEFSSNWKALIDSQANSQEIFGFFIFASWEDVN